MNRFKRQPSWVKRHTRSKSSSTHSIKNLFSANKGAAKKQAPASTLGSSTYSDGNPSSVTYEPVTMIDRGAREIFGHSSLRGRQKEIMTALLRGRDVAVVMPTGGGKSLCFQLPACLSKGVAIVISPLLALIEDQLNSLLRAPCGGVPAAALSSSTPPEEVRAILSELRKCERGEEPVIKLLYLTPERVTMDSRLLDILDGLKRNGCLSMVVIDECHCISAWGHCFRKEYGQLGKLKDRFRVPTIALTATATRRVLVDCISSLHLENPKVVEAGFDRPNLRFSVKPKAKEKIKQYKQVHEIIKEQNRLAGHPVSGIVYCYAKADTEALCDYLVDQDIRADYYHAGISQALRESNQARWSRGEIDVVCATIAYGMGIDRASVRYVVHATMPKSIEGYYQEAGRAGRDGKRAECVLFYRKEDISKVKFLITGTRGKRLKNNAAKSRELRSLEQMKEFCENKKKCRRALLAEHFGVEVPQCTVKCDTCGSGSGSGSSSSTSGGGAASSSSSSNSSSSGRGKGKRKAGSLGHAQEQTHPSVSSSAEEVIDLC
ncbi:unnamed protein product [Chrysoparadoxa australica]